MAVSNDGKAPGRTPVGAAAINEDAPLLDLAKPLRPPISKVWQRRGRGGVQSDGRPHVADHVANGRRVKAPDFFTLGLEWDDCRWEQLVKA